MESSSLLPDRRHPLSQLWPEYLALRAICIHRGADHQEESLVGRGRESKRGEGTRGGGGAGAENGSRSAAVPAGPRPCVGRARERDTRTRAAGSLPTQTFSPGVVPPVSHNPLKNNMWR